MSDDNFLLEQILANRARIAALTRVVATLAAHAAKETNDPQGYILMLTEPLDAMATQFENPAASEAFHEVRGDLEAGALPLLQT